MKIGLDYWQVCSHYPDYFREPARAHLAMNGEVQDPSAGDLSAERDAAPAAT